MPPLGAVPPSDTFSKLIFEGLVTVVPMSAKPAPRLVGEHNKVLEVKPSSV